MKIWIYSLCRNEADLIPFYLRHYEQFADKIFVWDDWSTDNSWELLTKHPKVCPSRWSYDTGIDEDLFLRFANRVYPTACGKADWVMWVDMDEFIYGNTINQTLELAKVEGYDVIQTEGFNMVGEGLPKDDGRQLTAILPMGVRAPIYSKPVVFNPCAKISWNRGKHALEGCAPRMTPDARLKLLHYRYLGRGYTALKNAKNYDRVGIKSGDKGAAWSCAPDYHGEHSADWAATIKDHAFNVFTR